MGYEPRAAADVLAWLNVGGATGGAVFGFLATRINLRPLTIAALIGATLMIYWFGSGAADLRSLTIVVACAGFSPIPPYAACTHCSRRISQRKLVLPVPVLPSEFSQRVRRCHRSSQATCPRRASGSRLLPSSWDAQCLPDSVLYFQCNQCVGLESGQIFESSRHSSCSVVSHPLRFSWCLLDLNRRSVSLHRTANIFCSRFLYKPENQSYCGRDDYSIPAPAGVDRWLRSLQGKLRNGPARWEHRRLLDCLRAFKLWTAVISIVHCRSTGQCPSLLLCLAFDHDS